MINENEIARCVRRAMDGYFRDLEGEKPCALHSMVMNTVEKPLLEIVFAPGSRESDAGGGTAGPEP